VPPVSVRKEQRKYQNDVKRTFVTVIKSSNLQAVFLILIIIEWSNLAVPGLFFVLIRSNLAVFFILIFIERSNLALFFVLIVSIRKWSCAWLGAASCSRVVGWIRRNPVVKMRG